MMPYELVKLKGHTNLEDDAKPMLKTVATILGLYQHSEPTAHPSIIQYENLAVRHNVFHD